VAGLDRTSVGTANVSATALRFFFKVTLKRHDLADELISTREPRRLPVVLSSEEVGQLLAAATNIKHRASLSLAYATGLRASEVVSLKLTDIDRVRHRRRNKQAAALASHAREYSGLLLTPAPAHCVLRPVLPAWLLRLCSCPFFAKLGDPSSA
jgi:integrase